MIRRFALLQTFVAVARAGKMKQAAHELALTPGAVSQRIRQLEEAAGRRLFTRTSTGVELSAAGEAMFVARWPSLFRRSKLSIWTLVHHHRVA